MYVKKSNRSTLHLSIWLSNRLYILLINKNTKVIKFLPYKAIDLDFRAHDRLHNNHLTVWAQTTHREFRLYWQTLRCGTTWHKPNVLKRLKFLSLWFPRKRPCYLAIAWHCHNWGFCKMTQHWQCWHICQLCVSIWWHFKSSNQWDRSTLEYAIINQYVKDLLFSKFFITAI